MKYLFLLIVIFFNAYNSSSQSFQTDWRHCFGHIGMDEANDMIKTNTGYYILGTANSKDIWLIKTDLEGNLLWDKKFGGTQVDYSMRLIPISNSQFYIVGGTFSNDGDITYDPYPYSRDYWIVKIDSLGNKIWDKVYGGNDRDEVWSGCYSTNDEVVIAGWSVSTDGDVPLNYGFYDMWILKLDSAGNKVWNTIIATDGQDLPGAIKQTNDKGYIMGSTSVSVSQPSGNIPCVDPYQQAELVINKLDSMGNIQWNRCYGGSEKEGLLDILEVSDGYLAACQSGSNDGVFKLSDAQYAIAAQAMSYEWSCVEENDIVLFKITDTLINGISNNILANLVKAYPSPAQQVINFDNAGPFSITMSIIDPLGIKKDELLLSPGSNSIELINYRPGMYIFQYNTSGQIITGKFIVY